jgi:hypothetical protein
MALSKTIEFTPVGFTQPAILQNAYIRVESVNGGKNSLSASVVVYSKKDAEMLAAQNLSFAFAPKVGPNADDFIAQAYEHLKTLPEFSGATDC